MLAMGESASRRPLLLVVDDEEDNCTLVARIFKREFEVVAAENGDHALAIAREREPAVVISDQRMPGMTGVELLEHMRHEAPGAIRVLATAFSDYAVLVDAVNTAAVHYYVEKPFNSISMRSMIEAMMRSRELEAERENLLEQLRLSEARLQSMVAERTRELALAIEELEHRNRELRDIAVRDGLTGLYNHRYLIEYLQIEVARSRRYDRVFSILFLDIDDFKKINDSYGHQVGDQVLRALAALLKHTDQRMRKSDFAARYGGEEFVVVLPETNIAGAVTKAERIREAAAALDLASAHPELRRITVSIGAASFPDHGADGDVVIAAADAALYDAKRSGKNCVRTAG